MKSSGDGENSTRTRGGKACYLGACEGIDAIGSVNVLILGLPSCQLESGGNFSLSLVLYSGVRPVGSV